jgi:hypothetical protein
VKRYVFYLPCPVCGKWRGDKSTNHVACSLVLKKEFPQKTKTRHRKVNEEMLMKQLNYYETKLEWFPDLLRTEIKVDPRKPNE